MARIDSSKKSGILINTDGIFLGKGHVMISADHSLGEAMGTITVSMAELAAEADRLRAILLDWMAAAEPAPREYVAPTPAPELAPMEEDLWWHIY